MVDLDHCPICQTITKVVELADVDSYRVNCPRCGNFELTDDAVYMFANNTESTKTLSVGYWIRNNQLKKGFSKIDSVRMRALIIPFVTLKARDQANNLLLWIGNMLKKPDDEFESIMDNLIPIAGAYDVNGVDYIIQYLKDEGLFSNFNRTNTHEGTYFSGTLSFKGWDRYYELQRTNKDSHLAFMAMKFGEEPLKSIYESVIKSAVDKTGFEIRKLDEEPKAGLIDDKLRVEIRRSKFLVADLTHDNNGAYWEAGFAEGLGMPVIYICEEEKFMASKSHFDTNHHLTVTWKNDEAGLKKFAEDLKATIRATLPAEAKMED